MRRKIILSIVIGVLFLFFIQVLDNKNKTEEEKRKRESINIANETNMEYVTDDCINGWNEYAQIIEEEIEDASKTINDENRIYLLKDNENIINIYYLDKENEEILYKTTEISTEYLPKEDVEKLKEGIKVKGVESLNKILEDFES